MCFGKITRIAECAVAEGGWRVKATASLQARDEGGWHQGGRGKWGRGGQIRERFWQENLRDLLGGGEMRIGERKVQGCWITMMGSLREAVGVGKGGWRISSHRKLLEADSSTPVD